MQRTATGAFWIQRKTKPSLNRDYQREHLLHFIQQTASIFAYFKAF
jgi:hypothetical protein